MRFCCIAIIMFFTFIAAVPVRAQMSLQSGFQIDFWSNEAGDKGRQMHIPVTLEGRFDQFGFRVFSAQVYNRIEPDTGENRNIDGWVDTRINLDYEITNRWPVDVLVALDINLPTGRTGLPDMDLMAFSDSDLVPITRMGEGFNINPGITLLKRWNRLLAALGLSYVWRGSYDASETLTDYDPGNALNITSESVYAFNPQWTGRLFLGWTGYNPDRIEAMGRERDYYQAGDVWQLGAAVAYTRSRWSLGGRLTRVVRAKEARLDFTGALHTETHNSYGDEWIAEINGQYSLADRTDLRADIRYLTVDANDYTTTDWRHVSRRTKTAISCEVIHRWNTVFESGLRLSAFTLNVADNPDNWVDEVDYRGAGVALWGALKF